MRLGPNDFDRQPSTRPNCTLTLVVFLAATFRISGNSDIERTVGAVKDVAVMHDGEILLFASPLNQCGGVVGAFCAS
jgi:hypothetical protein